MDDIGYSEAKDLVIEVYNDFIQEEGSTPEQAIAATLEDSIQMSKKNKAVYASVILNLGLLCVKEKYIVDYIYDRLHDVMREDLKNLSDEDKTIYTNDKKMIEELLGNKDFRVRKDEIYKARIDMLFAGL